MGYSKIAKETFTITTCATSSSTDLTPETALSRWNGMIAGLIIQLPTIVASGAASATLAFYNSDDLMWWSTTLTASSAALTYAQSAVSLPIQENDYWKLTWSEETSSAWSSATSAETTFDTKIYCYIDA